MTFSFDQYNNFHDHTLDKQLAFLGGYSSSIKHQAPFEQHVKPLLETII